MWSSALLASGLRDTAAAASAGYVRALKGSGDESAGGAAAKGAPAGEAGRGGVDAALQQRESIRPSSSSASASSSAGCMFDASLAGADHGARGGEAVGGPSEERSDCAPPAVAPPAVTRVGLGVGSGGDTLVDAASDAAVEAAGNGRMKGSLRLGDQFSLSDRPDRACVLRTADAASTGQPAAAARRTQAGGSRCSLGGGMPAEEKSSCFATCRTTGEPHGSARSPTPDVCWTSRGRSRAAPRFAPPALPPPNAATAVGDGLHVPAAPPTDHGERGEWAKTASNSGKASRSASANGCGELVCIFGARVAWRELA